MVADDYKSDRAFMEWLREYGCNWEAECIKAMYRAWLASRRIALRRLGVPPMDPELNSIVIREKG